MEEDIASEEDDAQCINSNANNNGGWNDELTIIARQLLEKARKLCAEQVGAAYIGIGPISNTDCDGSQGAGVIEMSDNSENSTAEFIEEVQMKLGQLGKKWVTDITSLDDLVIKLQALTEFPDFEVLSHQESDQCILENASGGGALHGIFFSRDIEECLRGSSCVLETPQNFRLCGPIEPRVEDTFTFISRKDEDRFYHMCKSFGLGFALAGENRFPGTVNQDGDNQQAGIHSEMKSVVTQTYVSTVKQFSIPTASCYLIENNMRLSHEAIAQLAYIQQQVKSNESSREQVCRDFLAKFGSHVQKGPITLGGQFILKASAYDFRGTEFDTMKKVTSDVVHTLVKDSFAVMSLSGEVNALDLMDKLTEIEGKYTEDQLKAVIVSTCKRGGPEAVENFEQWRSHLIADNSTWCLIDMGCPPENMIGIWDVLLQHGNVFGDEIWQLADSLYSTWVKMTWKDSDQLIGQTLQQVLVRVEQSILTVYENDSQASTANKYIAYLKELCAEKQTLSDNAFARKYWTNNILTSKHVQLYLSEVCDSMENGEFQAHDPSSIKAYMCAILNPVAGIKPDSFPKLFKILRQISESTDNKSIAVNERILSTANLKELLNILIDRLIRFEETEFSVTRRLNMAVYKLLMSLQNRGHVWEKIWILIAASNCGYACKEHMFTRYLTLADLQSLNRSLEYIQSYMESNSICGSTVEQNQAFTFWIKIADAHQIILSDVIAECIVILQLDHSMCDTIQVIVTQALTENDLDLFLASMLHISTHHMPSAPLNTETEETQLSSRLVETRIEETDKINEPSAKPTPISSAINVLKLDKSKSDIIERLGVFNLLNNKLSVCEIVTTVVDESANTSGENYILINFLKKLFLLDYRARQMHSVGGETDNDMGANTTQAVNSAELCLIEFLQKPRAVDNMSPSQISAADVMFCALHCSNTFLQQEICEKLALCQLAVPLIIPPLEGIESTYLLWSFHKIVKKWKSHIDPEISKEGSMSTHGVFNVAIMRLGDNANCMSKSKILNHMLGKCQGGMQHDYFLYRESDSPRILSNGLVEACWFLPECNSGEIIPDIVCFLNLRGNGMKFQKQHDFLCQSAGLSIIFTDRAHLESHINDIMKITEACKLVLVVDAGKAGFADPDVLSDSIVIIDGKGRSMNEISIKLCTLVKNSMQNHQSLQSLYELAGIARNVGILIDEDEDSCLIGKRLADDMMQYFSDLPLEQAKKTIVPLQGQNWIEWAKHDKEKSRLEKKGAPVSLETYLDKLEAKMKLCREAQVKNGISECMLLLIKSLETEKTVRKYFLRFLQINLDNLSRGNLPPLYRAYNSLKLEVRQLEQKIGKIEMKMRTNREISDVEREEFAQTCKEAKAELELKKRHIGQLMNGFMSKSFGLEHYLRELAQVYEAYTCARPMFAEEQGVDLSLLPDFMADLILEGYPIELMDGSVSHIPIKWVTAVLTRLQAKLGDVRLSVLSVIGVESSGKSTMLNTMFGLRFAVSSGRCTRGVFAQMLKMDDSLKERLNSDYMLVLDTEGLRSPELSFSETYRHDNEIATFVICLSDLTLINIGGQTLGNDMTDILQISAHAFIRMKEIELNSKCMFVNQNVADSAAGNKKAQGMESLLKKLDEMTQAAAEEEGLSDQYWTFSQVFPLILNEDIQFIPGLWQGGMSPPNPLYSEKLGKLKSAILKEIQDGISLSSFISRLTKLWEAVKEENFIFSFQNSLVIREHAQLQHLYGKWTVKLNETVMTWELKAKQTLIMTGRDKLNEGMERLKSDLEDIVSGEIDKVQEQLDQYFTNSKDNNTELIIRFKTEFEEDLVRISRRLTDNAWATCTKVCSIHNNAPRAETLKKTYRDRLFVKARERASQLREQDMIQISKDDALNNEALQSEFNRLYQQLLIQAERDNPTTRMPEGQIEQDLQMILFKKLSSVKKLDLRKELCKPVVKILNIQPDRHFQRIRRANSPSTWIGSLNNNENIGIANIHLNEILGAVQMILGNKQIEEIGYQPEISEQLISLILDMITEFEDPNKRFMFTMNFKIDVLVYVMSYAPYNMLACHKTYEKNQSFVVCIENAKDNLYDEFIAFFLGSTHDALAANRLCSSLLAESVTAYMRDLLGNRLFNKMLEHDVFRSKLDLNGTILADLATGENVGEYLSYMRKYKTFVGEWVLKYIAKVCLDTVNTDGGIMTLVEHITDQEIRSLIKEISHAMTETTAALLGENIENPPREVPRLNQWIEMYTSNLQRQTLLYFDTSLSDIISGYHIQDYVYFTQQAVENCLKLPEHVMKNLKIPTIGDSKSNAQMFVKNLTRNVHSRLLTHVIGCGKFCPFCGVACDLQTSTHSKHKSELHKPQGINGFKFNESRKLVHEICTSLVASDSRYRFNDGDAWRPYKDYAEEFPNWFIQSIKDADATLYWKWVFKTFNKELAAHYNVLPADLPSGWYDITKEQALANLNSTYNM